MSLINVSNLTFAYEGSYDNIFENVSFQIDTDWKLGFTGRNGRGKTTFLNLLLGKYKYGGSITASVKFEYFPYIIQDESINTIDVVERISADHMHWELMRELSLLEVDEDVLYRPFATLSNGERTKVLLAALFLKENNFLLIDEPTNHLDMRGREIVSNYLNSKKGFIVVSHDRAFLDGCIDHIPNIEIQQGNFSSWLYNKELQDNYELAENEKLKKEISRLKQSAREKAGWANTAEDRKIGFDPDKTEKSIGRRPYEGAKSKKMMKRAKVIEARQKTAIAEKSSLLKNIEISQPLKLSQLPYHKNILLSLKDVSINYGEKIACRNISFTVKQGDRIALCGKNGSGKSSIIKLICGEEISYTGGFEKGSRLLISYVSQDTCKLDFSRIQFEKDMASFSEGQKKKVLIAKSLCEKAHLHIWDEPLNFIDVISRMQIENLLLEFKPTIIFVEHDSMFCNNIATERIYL